VNCYSPTEFKTSEHDIDVFYRDIFTALREAGKACGHDKVPILGDFNIHLGYIYHDLYPDTVGKFQAVNQASPGSTRVMALCEIQELIVMQTWWQQQKRKRLTDKIEQKKIFFKTSQLLSC
jgi:hypothetical protein